MGRAKKFTDAQLWEATKELLLEVGYDAFTVSLLAEKLNVSRAVIYKYYPNKEELVIQFMVEKMHESVTILTGIDEAQSFRQMFGDTLTRIFHMRDLHHVLGFAAKVATVSELVGQKKDELSAMHHNLYKPLLCLIAKGKEEQIIAEEMDPFVLLSFIFSVINMQNHTNMPEQQFLQQIEQLLLYGILKS